MRSTMPGASNRRPGSPATRAAKAAPKPAPGPESLRVETHPILRFERGRKLRFRFEGRTLFGYEGETIAAALVAAGITAFRHTDKLNRPRGFYCAVGKCSSCLMVVDGRPNTMVCTEPLREGVRVERQLRPRPGTGKLP